MSLPQYEVFALRYGTRDARSSSHFLGGDPHDVPMPMDYFVWVAVGPDKTFVIDTGMTQEDAIHTCSDGVFANWNFRESAW